jgi:hypothetical protein
MPDLAAPDYQIARFVIERGLAVLYLIGFVVAATQFPALAGEHGLTPASRLIGRVRFRDAPSVFHLGYTDRGLLIVAGVGAVVSLGIVVGLAAAAPLPVGMLAWFMVWALYQSIVNIGGRWYAFGWESLLLEAGFLAAFLGNGTTAPPWLVILAFRWLAFRIEFGAGLIKLRGDPCWRSLECMDYHHETQPLPNPLSWYFHRLPRGFHRFEVVGNFVAQLILPIGLFLPQPIASLAAAGMIGTQFYLVVSGNYAWLNWATILAAVAGVSDPVIRAAASLALPAGVAVGVPPAFEPTPTWFAVVVLGLAIVIVVLSWWPVRNMASPGQAMNASFNPVHIVNTYGAFGSVSRRRIEVVVEGTADDPREPDAVWREYAFKAKPGDVRRMPPQVAPYHLRLDWLMWFIPLTPRYAEGWFVPFLIRLLEADRAILALMGPNPFPDGPPSFVRARLYLYQFTTRAERRETHAWWRRTLVGELVGPLSLGGT